MRELKKSDLEKVIQEHQNDIENKQNELANLQENNTKLRRRYLNIKMKILPFFRRRPYINSHGSRFPIV